MLDFVHIRILIYLLHSFSFGIPKQYDRAHVFGAGSRCAIGRHLTRKSGVLCSIPGLATYFRFSFRFFKKGSCQLLAKVCARSTG